MEISELTELIPGLSNDLGLECLTRLHHSSHRVAIRVCHQWKRLFQSDKFYHHRKKTGHARKLACLVQAHEQPKQQQEKKPTDSGPPTYGITVFDPVDMSWNRVEPVPDYPLGLPLFCRLASSDGKLVLMGGWDPLTYQPVTAVFVYDFRSGRWRRGKDMPEKRFFFAIDSGQGRVYVAGGHDENKDAVRTAWVYDPRKDEWVGLEPMTTERDEGEAVVVGDELWVVSGYGTEMQGMEFEEPAEVLKFGSGQMKSVDGVWETGRGARSCVEIGKVGRWDELDCRVRVMVGLRALDPGSEYQGAPPHGFYLMEMEEGQNRKFRGISVPNGFSGFVQSGCCVEI